MAAWLRTCAGLLGLLLFVLAAAMFSPSTAHAAGSIRGFVFEDINYGGGAGRDAATSGGVGVTDARVEVFHASTGLFAGASNLDSLGFYKINGLAAGNYIVRVVVSSVEGTRLGFAPGTHIPVPTFWTDGQGFSPVPVTDHVGGHVPNQPDAGNAGSGDQIDTNTFQFLSGPSGYAQNATLVTVPGANAIVLGIDFGFNYSTITNTNDIGMGSLYQFLMNANAMDNGALAQDGLSSGIENAIFMISNGTDAPGLRAVNDYFTAGVASIPLQSGLPLIVDPVVLNAQTQPGWSGAPIVELDGTNAGVGVNGLEVNAPECEIRGFIIGGFDGSGVFISDVDCIVAGNYIGLDASGSSAHANTGDGVDIWADNATIGGSQPEDRNVISGNGTNGVRVEFVASHVTVKGNYIGTDASGTSAVGNSATTTPSAGLEANGDNLVLGGYSSGEGNVIAGNLDAGVRLSGFANSLVGNSIGVDASGGALGNAGLGVFVSADFGGSNLDIGGTLAGAGNVIANNGGNGVELDPLAGEGVRILKNTFTENGGLGIDLGGDGLSINDPLDLDGGPNSMQNYPEITLARTSDFDLHVAGTLTADPNTTFRVDVFASSSADPSGNGEGERWIGSLLASTDGIGDAVFDTTIAGVVAVGEAISTTATSLDFDNTSEFSAAFTAIEAAGIIVDPVSGLATSEAGDSALFTVVLESQPSADVVIPFSSSNATEGSTALPSITFTPGNWNVPQDVWVRGGNDFVVDGDQAYQIVVEPAVSSDLHYNGKDGADVDLLNADNDVAGITVAPTGGLATTEAGGTDVFTVVLDSEPVADVTITLASDTPAEGTTDLTTLTFTAADWNVPQTVTVTGVDDNTVDGDVPYSIVLDAASSTDPLYDTMDPADVFANNADDDVASVAFDPAVGLTTTEAGGTATVNVHLTAQPAADVTFTLATDQAAEGTVDVATLTFTPADWNIDQVVTLTGVDDVVVDGDQSWHVVTSAMSSTDPIFDTVDVDDLAVTNTDDDVAEVTVNPTAGLVTDESGATATFDLVLTSQPSADVTFTLASDAPAEGTADVSSVTFTAANWNVPQTVTVSGVNDDVDDGDIAYNIALAAVTSADANFNGYDPADVAVTNTDDDVAGITVTPTGGVATTEAGGTDVFTVVLDSEPTADVTVSLSSDTPSEGTPDVTSLTFTAANWNVPQTITLTGVNDFIVDGDTPYTIVIDPAASTDPNYDQFDANDVFALNSDDDNAGFTVTPTSGLTTTEAGSTASFTVVMTSQPTSDVVFTVVSSDVTEGTVSTPVMIFTAADWNVAQTVTVTGVNDAVDDGDINYNVVLGAVSSADGVYSGFDVDDVALTNTDDDAAGIVVSPTNALATTEAGGTATFGVVLTSQPTANVVVTFTSSDVTEGTVSPGTVTFTPANWNVSRTITVTGVNDFAVDGTQNYTVAVNPATSTDPNYSGMDGADVSLANLDNDVAGITVNPIAGLTTTEAGGTASFTVRLNSQPSADVVIAVASNDASEGTASASSLTFTPANWNVNQTVTVTGVDDAVQDGNIAYAIVLSAAVSSDTDYNAMDAADVSASNSDDDAVGITVSPLAGLVTTEAGATASFTVVLNSQPTADVVIGIASDDASEGTVSTSSLTFTAADWNVAQTVTVTGVNDDQDDADVAYAIQTAAAVSADPNYSGVDAGDVAVTNTDDDAAGISLTPVAGLTTTEAGGAVTFSLVLQSEPTADVTIGLQSSNTAEGAVSPSSYTFTAANWNVAQTVTVTGVDESIDDGDASYVLSMDPATSSDPSYAGANVPSVSLTNTDDDAAGITVNPVAGLVTTEAGASAAFTIALESEPTADVTIAVASSNTGEGTVSASSLTFTSANWNVAQTVTVTGVDEAIDDGDVAYSIVNGAAVSSDPNYSAMDVADVAVTNTDDDASGIAISPVAGLVTTEAGGTASFSVVLESEPVADVTIALSSDNTAEGTIPVSSLTFTSANWNVAQTVTISGVDDAVDDGDIAYSIVTGVSVSSDPNYSGVTLADVAVTNTDDDAAAITITPVAGLVTTEAGGTAAFSVVLESQPTADVTIALSSDNTAEGTIPVSSLTFTAANWNVAQTVTISGVDDAVDDGDIAYSIVTGASVSSDPNYSGVALADVAVTNTDDDAAAITINPTAGLVTTEAGGTASFTVVLGSQPTADVTIGLSSSNSAEGTIPVSSLTFTAADWNVAQTVTITGIDDTVDDGDIAYSIVTGASVSSDPNYSGVALADVSVSNTDDDAAAITVTPTAGLVTTEAGGSASFTVVLGSQPTADVTIAVSSNNTAEGTASASSLTFTAGNWNVAQTVTVTGVGDLVDDGDIAYGIVLGNSVSSDPNYSGVDVADVAVTNTDDDASGISISPVSGLVTTEAGGTAAFSVVLQSQPTADVSIALSSSNTAEGSIPVSSLTFTAANWNVAQTVTITGVDEAIDDGDIAYSIVTGASVSSDPNYSGVALADVAVTNTDDDASGITISPTAGLVTTEAGGTASFTVVLGSQPTADVSIALSSSNTAEGSIPVSSLTFTTANWNVAQTVTVTGVDEAIDDGDIAYSIVTGASVSSDPNYSGVALADVAVTNTDDDGAGINITPTAGLVTTEAGGTASFTVSLGSQPTADVSIALSSSNTAEGTIPVSALTFTAVNWNVPQTVTITGVSDAVDDGDIAYSIITGASVSSDPNYSGVTLSDVAVSNTDDDTKGITVTPVAGLVTSEAGASASFTVVLESQPLSNVVIPVSSNDTSEGTVSPSSLTFTAANWNVAQTVTVTGVNDQVQDGAIAYGIVLGAATSSDPNYSGLDPADVAVSNTDDDVAGITVTPVAGLTTTEAGGSASFTVVMTAQPTADVVIGISSSNPAEGTVSASSLTFTAANWNLAQTVTVTGVNDAIADGAANYTIVTAPAVSSDPLCSGLDAADVSVTNTDDDATGISVTPVAGLATSEAGGSASFTVVLQSQPIADVIIPVTSSNTAEGTVSPSSLTFTSANWNLAQTVTITGVDDAVVDGVSAYTVVLGGASSSDPAYAGADAADVAVTNTDNDATGITVTPVAGLSTTEAGGSATFSITLGSQPVADVVIPVSSSDVTEGTASPASLTFTAADWNQPHVVTITGVNDPIVDGDIAYTVVTGPASSSDPLYSGFDPSDVAVVNLDDQDGTSMTMELVADRSRVQQGQPVSYRLSVRNRTNQSIDAITLTHVLPARFAALKGTLVMNGAVQPDQLAGTQSLVIPTLPAFVDQNGDGVAGPGESGYLEFRWQLVPGAGATAGRYTANVSAISGCPTCVVAQPVSASVTVEENELFTRSTLLGRVFEDKDRNGQQGADEPGLANARVVMDDGTVVTTDAKGMFHVPDLEAGPRVIKMDMAAAGAGAVPTTGVSQVVDIAPGLLASVRFGVAFPRDTVSVGRNGVDGLRVSVREPEGTLDLAGTTSKPNLKLNGITVPVQVTNEIVAPPVGEPHYPSVTLGALAVSVDSLGRFDTAVPHFGDEKLEIALVDRKGRKSIAQVRLPKLDIVSPRGEVRLPFGQSTDEIRTNTTGALVESAAPIAGTESATGSSPVAFTTLKGVTDAGVQMTVNGQPVMVAADGAFAVEVPLHVGANTFAMVAKDSQGLTNSAMLAVDVADRDAEGKSVVVVDAIPELSLYLPPHGTPLQSNALGLAGRTRPGYRLTMNGEPVQVNSDGSFSRRVMLAEGFNHLKFEVTDEAGRTAVVERDLEVRSPKMFLVALADGVVGQSSGAAFLRKGADKTYTEGRVAWNLRGWVAGKYLLTSAFDSRRRDFGSLFKNLDDNGRDRLLTNLDPDKMYPVFGDSGSVRNSELQGGRLYVGLQGEAVKASLGNFPIALDQVELAGFRRTLYGAQLRFGKTSGNDAIPAGTSVALFGAQASHIKVHDVLEATGGTLYYLSHREVLEGSAQVSLVVRDRVTGLQIARVPQRLGSDVVVKEFEGRLHFMRPVASVWDDGGLVGNGRLQGHPVTIEVDYETRGSGSEKTAVGGRITQSVGNKLQVGGTVVDDQASGGDYRLRGTDFTASVAKGTKLSAEIATSNGRSGRAFNSTDGGLLYNSVDSVGEQSGMAWKTAAELDLGTLMGKPGKASVSAYMRRVESGFISDGERDGIAIDRQGLRGRLDAGKWGQFTTRYDHENRPEASIAHQIYRNDQFGMQWRQDGRRTGVAAEFEQHNSFKTDELRVARGTGAMRLWWKPVEKVKTSIEHQQSLSGEAINTSALALEWKALSNLALEARGSTGDQGKTIRGGAMLTVGSKQFYMREERTEAVGTVRGGTLFGMQAPLGPESRVYSEYQWQRDPMGDHGVSVTGIEQAWHSQSGVALSLAGEHGTRGGASGQHGTISGALSYRGRGPVSGTTRAEARRGLVGTRYMRQMLSSTRVELALPAGFTALTDLRMSMSRTRENLIVDTETPNRFTESSFGLSWRNPNSDAFQALGRWTRLADRRASSLGDSLGLKSVLGVAALEATTRIAPGVEWAVKGAARLAEDGRPGQPSAVAHSSLFASRLDYRLGQQPLRLGVEYRLLSQRESDDHRSGWLNELSYDANQHTRFGVGYNFSRFSGDPLVREQDSARGWFIRAQSRY